jgi:phosphohistidine phosphatase
MKTLYLLRHAKSDWSEPGLGDFDRPLAPRGTKAAPRMGKAIRKKGLIPAVVLCSEARRALETWSLIEPELRTSVPVKALRSLYLAPPSKLLAAIRRISDEHASAMVIGHNPGMESLAAGLAGPRSDPDALRRMRNKFPTAALAVFDFDTERWADIGPGQGRLTAFLAPRDLT